MKKDEKPKLELTLNQILETTRQNHEERKRDREMGRFLIWQQVRKIFGIKTLILLLPLSLMAQSSTKLHGYTKKDVTHVESYHRTKSDGTTKNNYSHKGNTNPYTGKKGNKK